MLPSVSVIVPVYNVEPFIRQCVDSVLAQSLRQIELILVDDGSTDGSGPICDAYAAKDERVRVIHQQNAGVSVARNRGIEAARADWIMMADGDDWLEPDAVKTLYDQALGPDGSDIVVGSYFFNYPDHVENTGQAAPRDWKKEYPLSSCRRQIICYVLEEVGLEEVRLMHGNLSSPWAKIFRKALITDNGLSYVPGMQRAEDQVFNLYAFQMAEKITLLNVPVYHYRFRDSSACRREEAGTLSVRIYEQWYAQVRLFFDRFYPTGDAEDVLALYTLRLANRIQSHYTTRCVCGLERYKDAARQFGIHLEQLGIDKIPLFSNPYMSKKENIQLLMLKMRVFPLLTAYRWLKRKCIALAGRLRRGGTRE